MARGFLPSPSSYTLQASINLELLMVCGGIVLGLQAACKNAEVLPHLVATVQQSQSPEVQLLAAQTLRKHIPRFWRRLNQQVPGQLAAWDASSMSCSWVLPNLEA